jgi:uncharacterized membrane protein
MALTNGKHFTTLTVNAIASASTFLLKLLLVIAFATMSTYLMQTLRLVFAFATMWTLQTLTQLVLAFATKIKSTYWMKRLLVIAIAKGTNTTGATPRLQPVGVMTKIPLVILHQSAFATAKIPPMTQIIPRLLVPATLTGGSSPMQLQIAIATPWILQT